MLNLLAVLCFVAGVVLLAYSLHTMHRLSNMLRQVLEGHFQETGWNETHMSRLEGQFARFVAANALSRQRLAAEQSRIKELVSDISHQTKTPLSNIIPYTQLLEECELPADGQDLAHEINHQGEKLHFLIDSLVKISRLENGIIQASPQVRQIRPMLEEVTAAWQPKASKKNITLALDPGQDFTACFDAKWTAEVLDNLLDNAIKYTPAGGQVRINADCFQMYCRVSVIDNGIGLSETEQAQVFERFYRAPAAAGQPGVGLGLYLARQIIAAQQGYMRILRRKSGGTEFSFFLPCGNTASLS